MNLLEMLTKSQNGAAIQEVARSFNLDSNQATSALNQLVPALTSGLKKSMGSQSGLEGLLGALKSGNHGRYLDDPSSLTRPEAVQDGNGILGHILGSKDASRQVAAQAAQSTGLDVNMLKKMLPMVAAMTMGGMSKQASAQPNLLESLGAGSGAGASGAAGMLGKFLDADGDGSVADDLLGMAKKFF